MEQMGFQLRSKAGIYDFHERAVLRSAGRKFQTLGASSVNEHCIKSFWDWFWGFWEAFHWRITENETAYRAKSAGSRLKLNMPTPYVYMAFYEVTCIHCWMVYTECVKTAAISCGTSHNYNNQTVLQVHHFSGCSKCALKNCSHLFRITCDKSAVSAWERRI